MYFPSILRWFQMYSYDQLNMKPQCSPEAPWILPIWQKQSGLQLCDLWWDRTFPINPYGVILIFLSDFSLVTAGPFAYCFSCALWHPIHRTEPLYWFSQEIYTEHFESLVKAHIAEHNFSLSWSLPPPPPPLLLRHIKSISPFASCICSPQSYRDLPGYHFLYHAFIKNGFYKVTVSFLREIWWKSFLPLTLYELMSFVTGMSYSMFPVPGKYPSHNRCLPIGRQKGREREEQREGQRKKGKSGRGKKSPDLFWIQIMIF